MRTDGQYFIRGWLALNLSFGATLRTVQCTCTTYEEESSFLMNQCLLSACNDTGTLYWCLCLPSSLKVFVCGLRMYHKCAYVRIRMPR